MILSDRENKLALARHYLRITPVPGSDRFSSMAIDLTLDDELTSWNVRTGERPIVAPNAPDFDVTAIARDYGNTFLIPPEGFLVEPWAFVLGWTAERIQLPQSSR